MGLLLLTLIGSALAAQVITPVKNVAFFGSLLRYFTKLFLLFQELQPIPALPLALQRGQGRIVGGDVANDGEFPFQVRE